MSEKLEVEAKKILEEALRKVEEKSEDLRLKALKSLEEVKRNILK